MKPTSVTGLFGVVTGIDAEMIPKNNAADLSDVDVENGVAKPRRGYRNIIAPVTNQTTLKGAFFCQIYVSGVLKEAFVLFAKISGTLKPYEMAYDSASDSWTLTEIKNGASSLSLSDTYWRCVCYGDKAYFVNANDTSPVNSYTVGTTSSWAPVKPPASPTTAPSIAYYKGPSNSYSYARYFGASTGYVAGDVTVDATVASAVALSGKNIKVTISSTGEFTVTAAFKHSSTAVDFSYNDVFWCDLIVNDPETTSTQIDLENITATMNASGSQDLIVTVASRKSDTKGRPKSVRLYIKFGGKGSRSSWSACTTMTLKGSVTSFGSTDYLFISPITAGGIVDWGKDTEAVTQLMYARYESTTLFESGPSPALSLTLGSLLGSLLNGDTNFPLGTMPIVTMAGAADSDTLRLYGRVKKAQPDNVGKPETYGVWRRIVSQSDATTTYQYAVIPDDFATYSEYAPAPFDYSTVTNAFVFRQSVCWLYPGGSNNIRFSRYANPVAQANNNDAFRTDLGQDDDFRGSNFTLSGFNQDQPVAGTQMGTVAVIFGNQGVYLVADTMNGLPQGFTPPKAVPKAPGIHGPEAFAIFDDTNGTPVIVYVVQGGQSLYAIRIPNGVSELTLALIEGYEFSSLVRGSADVELFGSSALKDTEATHVYYNGRDDSLHVRYNTREWVFRRPDLLQGKRPWTFYNYSTGQHADQWQKFKCVQSSIGWLKFGFRLNGAVDEFEEANYKHPTSGTHDNYISIDGSGVTPASFVAATDIATFTLPPCLSTGTAGTFEFTANGVTAGTTYYLRKITSTTASWYDTRAHAQAGGGTGLVNLTGATWSAGAFTPLGPEDGDDFTNAPYWTSKVFFGNRRRLRQIFIDKVVSTDSVVATAISDRQTSNPCTVSANKNWAHFGPRQTGFRHQCKFTLSARHSGVRGFRLEENEISQRRQS